jgi:hypothetical protein
VNGNPELSKIIQFNSVGGLGLFGPLVSSPAMTILQGREPAAQ